MSTVILGAGSVGFQLAKQLIEAKEDVVLIEKNNKRAALVAELLDCTIINDQGTSVDVLKQAGLQKATNFIAVTDSDEVNLVTCGMVVNNFSVPCKIARVRNIDYLDSTGLNRPILGIDYVVNPEIEVSRAIMSAIERGATSDILFFEKTGLQMRSITTSIDSLFIGKSVGEISAELKINFLVAVIVRDAEYIIPAGDFRILENDKLYLIASDENFTRIFEHIGKSSDPPKKITVIGGNRIGQYVVEHLLENSKQRLPILGRFLRPFGRSGGKSLSIIESDEEICTQLSEKFPQILVIHADLADEKFSEEDYLADQDLVVATMDNQELNLINAVYAKTLGTKRSIALVNTSNYLHIGTNLGIDVTISPIQCMITSILKHISDRNVRSVHNISGGYIDIIELSVEPGSTFAGKAVRDLKLPPHSLIVSVTRGEEHFVPTGNLLFAEGDSLIIIARRESVTKLKKVFGE